MTLAGSAGESFAGVLRKIYWSGRRDRRRIPHLVGVLAGFLRSASALAWQRWALGRRLTISVGLVEHLGDIVAAEPVARAIRRDHPGASLRWFVRAPYAAVPARFPAIDRVVTVGCLTEWMLLRASGLAGEAIDLHINGRYCPKCSVPIGKGGVAAQIGPETYYRFGNLLRVQCLSAGLAPIEDGPVLDPGPDAERRADGLGLPERFVVIHCASNEEARDWMVAKWRALVDHITLRLGLDVVEVGTVARVIVTNAGRERTLCGDLSILETAAVIRRSALLIGIDSGPAHIANAVGARGVILLGHYRGFERYMPYSGAYANGRLAELVRAEGPAATLTVETVVAAVERGLLAAAPLAVSTCASDNRSAGTSGIQGGWHEWI